MYDANKSLKELSAWVGRGSFHVRHRLTCSERSGADFAIQMWCQSQKTQVHLHHDCLECHAWLNMSRIIHRKNQWDARVWYINDLGVQKFQETEWVLWDINGLWTLKRCSCWIWFPIPIRIYGFHPGFQKYHFIRVKNLSSCWPVVWQTPTDDPLWQLVALAAGTGGPGSLYWKA